MSLRIRDKEVKLPQMTVFPSDIRPRGAFPLIFSNNAAFSLHHEQRTLSLANIVNHIKKSGIEKFVIRGHTGKHVIPPDEVSVQSNWRRFLMYYESYTEKDEMEIDFYTSFNDLTPLFKIRHDRDKGWNILSVRQKEGVITDAIFIDSRKGGRCCV